MYYKEIETSKEEAQRKNRELKAQAAERLVKVAAKIKQQKQRE